MSRPVYFVGSFLGMAAVGLAHFNFLSDSDMVMIIGSLKKMFLI